MKAFALILTALLVAACTSPGAQGVHAGTDAPTGLGASTPDVDGATAIVAAGPIGDAGSITGTVPEAGREADAALGEDADVGADAGGVTDGSPRAATDTDSGGGGGDGGAAVDAAGIDASTSCAACATVANSGTCASQLSDCAGDPDCAVFQTCNASCAAGDATCVESCFMASPHAATEAMALQSCTCSECAAECALDPSCASGE